MWFEFDIIVRINRIWRRGTMRIREALSGEIESIGELITLC